jgi:predicted  nucleic acid-binding Zn-ribbon protein
MLVRVPVSIGELLDKISILRIKTDRIADPAKVANVRKELEALDNEIGALDADRDLVEGFLAELEKINGELWVIEDDIRACEARQDFGEEFIRLARAVYRTNDVRAKIKKRANEATGSELTEEKSYVDPDG